MVNNPRKKSGLGLSSKLICILLPLVVLLASNLGIMFYFLIDIKSALPTTHAVSLLQSDLMKLEQHMNEFLLGEENKEEVVELQEKARTYLYALRDGNKELNIRGSPGHSESPSYQNLWWNWDRHIRYYEDFCQPFILQVLNAPTHKEQDETLYRRRSEYHLFMTDVSRTAAMSMEHFLLEPFITFSRFAQGLLIASIVLTGVGFFLIRLFIRRPLSVVVEGMEKITHGRWGKDIEIKGRDELDRLVDSFNYLSLQLENTINSLEKEKLELEEANKKLQESSYRDFMTGLYNFYFFQETLASEYLRARRHAHPLSLIMLDVDHFKHINDTLGHPFGDFVLQEMGKRIKGALRRTDIACRYGGEEFTILLPHTNLEGAQKVAEKIKDTLCGQSFKKDVSSRNVSVTLGIVSIEEPEVKEALDLVRLADEALREGKSRGGNCIVLVSQILRKTGVDVAFLQDYRKRLSNTESYFKRVYMDSTSTILRALAGKDDYSAVHSCLVATYVWHFTAALNLPQEEREVIKNAALLHDLGKISIPDAILNKKEGGLTDEEIFIVRQHPHHSAFLIEGIKFLERESSIILYHHERWDGQGYPSGLKGKDIPKGARVLALADTYEALTSDRPYRKARLPEEAFRTLKGESGHHFEPGLVEPFIEFMKEFLSTTKRVYISQLDRVVVIGS